MSLLYNPPVTQIIQGTVNQETNSEANRLLEIFPNEIWMHIISRIGKPDHLSCLRGVSQFFGELVKLQKTKVLFPEVIKIIVASLPGTAKEVRQILLNCRLVCQYWEFGIDSVLKSFSTSSKLVKPDHVYVTGSRPFEGITTTFLTTNDALACLQHFDEAFVSKNINPFLGGAVRVIYNNRINENSFAQLLLQIFRIYGHHVVNFKATCIESSSGLPEDIILCYEHLRDMLIFMPNLKELTIGPHYEAITKEGLRALQLDMQSCVFPEMISLQRLQLAELPVPVFDKVLRSYSHVTILTTDFIFTNTNDLLYPIQMPNLTQLAMRVPDNESLIQLETANVAWPLTCLQIRAGASNFDWEKLFQILENRWATTLTELRIETLYGNGFYDITMEVLPVLKLPNLKMFALRSSNFCPIDFILPLSNSLEHLQIWYDFRAAPDQDFIQNEKVVKLYSFSRNLKESNIWTLFPKLKNCYYYDRLVGYYQVSNRRFENSRNAKGSSFTIQHVRPTQN